MTLPDAVALRRKALVRTVRRSVIATLLVAAAAIATARFSGHGDQAHREIAHAALNLDVIGALESAAAMRFALALRAPDPRPDLEAILTRFPDTTSARRAVLLLDHFTRNR
ncbi:MAG: hypothetical protein HZB39_15150 [Planctomycetes bacterium]|nr:hypothetical protein [Planctomycetota bacterium]